jgi:hypothetical protein
MRCLFRLGVLVVIAVIGLLVVLYVRGCFEIPGLG